MFDSLRGTLTFNWVPFFALEAYAPALAKALRWAKLVVQLDLHLFQKSALLHS